MIGAGVAPAALPVEPQGAAGDITILARDAIDAIRGEWAALAGRSIVDNVFFGADFAIPAIAHIGPAGIGVAAVRDRDGALSALAPFTRSRLGRLAPAVQLWRSKYAPLAAPLLSGGDPASVLADLVEGLTPARSGLSLVLPLVETEGPLADALRAIAAQTGRPLAMLNPHVRAMLTRSGDSHDMRARLGGGQRKGMRRQLRRLEEIGRVSFEVAREKDDVTTRLEEFFAVELSGWKGKRGTALASSGATAAFAREAVLNLAASGKVCIHTLRLDDRPISALISLIAGATAFTWKIAYDEAYARFSPGVQLMLETPGQLFADPAVMRIDSCAEPDHVMIDRLWPERLGIATFVLGPPGGGAVHAVGLAAARAEIAARANARQLLNRR